MRILRLPYLVAIVLIAAGTLTACKGGGSSTTGSTTQLRFVQGNPALQTLDYQIDLGGTIIPGAQPNVVQPYFPVSSASHVISFFSSGTTKPPAAPAPTNCTLPALAANTKYTLVLVNQAGTSATPCVLFTEPASSGTAFVVYHNAAGNVNVKDQNGNTTTTLYPVFCQPQPSNAPCANPAVQGGSPVINGASVQVATPVVVPLGPSAAQPPGIGFTVTNAASGQPPLCQGTPSDPTFYPVTQDATDTANFIPNGGNDTIVAIYILDSINATSGTNACPVSIAASLAI